MRRNFRRIHEGKHAISPAWIKFLRFYACFAIFTTFSTTYIVTFLRRATGSDQDTMLYNLSQLLAQPFAMLAAVYLIRRKSALFSQRIGLVLYSAVFVAFCVGGEQVSLHYMWIGTLISAGNGFFFTTYALQILAYADDENRDASYGLQTAIGSAIGLVFPLLSGVLVAGYSDFTGYRILFGIGLAISLLAMYLSTRMDPIANISSRVQFKQALSVLIRNRSARAAMWVTMVNGFYSGSITFFITLLLYSVGGNERIVGYSVTIGSVITILASGVYMRIIRPENRAKSIAVSLTLMILSAVPLLFRVSVATLLIYHLTSAALSSFIFNPPLTAYLRVVERLDALKDLGGEVHALREFYLKIGQISGTLLTMLLANQKNGAALIIIIILMTQYSSIWLIRVMNRA